MRLAGIEGRQEAPASPAPSQSAPDTAVAPQPTPLSAEAAAAGIVTMQHKEVQADAANVTVLKEELESAVVRAHAYRVRVRSPSLY